MRTFAALLILSLVLAAAACSNEETVAEPAAVREELPEQGDLLSGAEYAARGDSRLQEGDYSAAIRDFAAALAFDEGNADVLRKRAAAYVHISLFHPEDDRPQLCRPGPGLPVRHRRLRQAGEAAAFRRRRPLPARDGAEQRRQIPERARGIRGSNQARSHQRRDLPEARLRVHEPERGQVVRGTTAP